MLRTTLVLCLSLLATPLFAQSFTYQGIPWGSSSADVQSLLKEKKFDEVSVSSDGNVNFHQKLSAIEVMGQAKFDDHGLNQIMVVYFPRPNEAVKLFDILVGSLSKAHGEPVLTIREFEEPYVEGDGFEDTAIRTGKAKLQAGWGSEDGAHVKMGAFTHSMRVAVITMYQAGAQE